MGRTRTKAVLAAAIVTALAGSATAGAHVQVRPAAAAPEDPVLFEVLVPNEDDHDTTRVELAVPKDVLPFSFEAEPGWKRTTTKNPDGSLRSIVWTGRLPAGGFARFSFLASTPPQEGTVAWKALQTYSGGEIVRWIGAPESEHPAATTRVAKDVPRQNAGGEAGDKPAAAEAATGAGGGGGDDDERDTLTLALAAVGVLLGGAALTTSLIRRKSA